MDISNAATCTLQCGLRVTVWAELDQKSLVMSPTARQEYKSLWPRSCGLLIDKLTWKHVSQHTPIIPGEVYV